VENEHHIKLFLPSQPGYEQIAMESAAAAARMMGFSPDRIEDLKTAVSEACLNSMEHGNRQQVSEKVMVALTLYTGKLQVTIHDSGSGIPDDVPTPDIGDKLAGKGTTRGWGMFLIKKLMDEVKFEKIPGKGHVTRMIIYLQEPSEEEG
jgi:serine/threonine-protein kinase RsbW